MGKKEETVDTREAEHDSNNDGRENTFGGFSDKLLNKRGQRA